MSDRQHCKVDEVVARYGEGRLSDQYDSIHDHLLALWTGADEFESHGYRWLTEWFNKRLIKTAYDESGRLTLGTRLEHDYETLTGDDDIRREELLVDLQQEGVNGRQLVDDMVSWSTMRRHLQECLDGEKPDQSAETDWERDSVDIATEQLEEKVRKALSSYENKDRIAGASDAEITVQVQLSCPECPTRRSLADALSLGYVCPDHLGTSETE